MKIWFAALFLVAACGGSVATPSVPQVSMAEIKADSSCQFQCADYGFSPDQCFQGWVCDGIGYCLGYVGTKHNPNSCAAVEKPYPACECPNGLLHCKGDCRCFENCY